MEVQLRQKFKSVGVSWLRDRPNLVCINVLYRAFLHLVYFKRPAKASEAWRLSSEQRPTREPCIGIHLDRLFKIRALSLQTIMHLPIL